MHPRPGPQESAVQALQQPQHTLVAGGKAQRAQQRDCAPHRCESGGPGQHPPILLGVEPLQSRPPVNRTGRLAISKIDERDLTAPVEPAHQSDLAAAQRTLSIVKHPQHCHVRHMGTPETVSQPVQREGGMEVAIIGAGIAGLACAARLIAGGCGVRLFDKGRGPGGRMATRRIELAGATATFDHGAQYFTARDPRFAAVVARWAEAGLAARWPAAGPDAWVGTPGMNAPLRALTQSCCVAWNRRVERLERGDRWRIHGTDTASLDAPFDARFDAIVVAVPAEQAAALLEVLAPTLAARAAAVPSLPCWTMLAAFGERLSIGPDIVRGSDWAALGWAARDNAKPGRAPGERWVIQAGAEWSRRHLEEDARRVAQRLLKALTEHAGAMPEPLHLTAHRWRYARTTATGPAVLWDPSARLGLCGDWCRGARVEDAWLSGDTLAAAILRE